VWLSSSTEKSQMLSLLSALETAKVHWSSGYHWIEVIWSSCHRIYVIGSSLGYLKSNTLKPPSSAPVAIKIGFDLFQEITFTSHSCALIWILLRCLSLDLRSRNYTVPSTEQVATPLASFGQNWISSIES